MDDWYSILQLWVFGADKSYYFSEWFMLAEKFGKSKMIKDDNEKKLLAKSVLRNFFSFSMISAVLFYALGLNMEKISISISPEEYGYELVIKNIGTTVFTGDNLSRVSPPKIYLHCQSHSIYEISSTPRLLPSEKITVKVPYESCPKCEAQLMGSHMLDSMEITQVPPRNWRNIFKNSIYVIVFLYGLWLLFKIAVFIVKRILSINPYLLTLTEPIPERRKVFRSVVEHVAKSEMEFKVLTVFHQDYVWENMQPTILHILNNWNEFVNIYHEYEYLIDNDYYYGNIALRDLYIVGSGSPGYMKMIMYYAFRTLCLTGVLRDIKDGKIDLEGLNDVYAKFYDALEKDYKVNKSSWHWMEADLWLHENYGATSNYYKYFLRNAFHLIIGIVALSLFAFYFGDFLIFNVISDYVQVLRQS